DFENPRRPGRTHPYRGVDRVALPRRCRLPEGVPARCRSISTLAACNGSLGLDDSHHRMFDGEHCTRERGGREGWGRKLGGGGGCWALESGILGLNIEHRTSNIENSNLKSQISNFKSQCPKQNNPCVF